MAERKKLTVRILLMPFLFCMLFITSAGAANDNEEPVLGLLPEMNVFKQKQRFEPLAAYLSEHLGIPVRLTLLSRYRNMIERIR